MAYAFRSRLLAAICASLLIPGPGFADVTFSGLDEATEKNARALMPIAIAPCTAPEWRVQRLFRNSDDKLQEALEALGYYRFDITKTLSFDQPDCWSANFDVQLGEPVKIRTVDVTISGEALSDPALSDRFVAQQPVVGSVLNHGAYESFKKSVLSRMFARGYFAAELTESRVVIDESLAHADIVIRAESASRYRFGKISFTQGILNEDLLRAYPDFTTGDYYNSNAVADLHNALGGSGYFESVAIRAEPVAGLDGEIPVDVTLRPAKRQVYSIGAGYATDNGIQGKLGYTNRRLTKSGHQFDSLLKLSEVDSSITGNYRWPRGRPDAEWVNLYGGYQRKRTDTSDSDKTTIGIRVARNRTSTWLETPYLDFSNEEYVVGDQESTSRLVMPGITWETTIGREFGYIDTGRRISLDLRGAYDKLWSDTSFAQATASAKWVASFNPKTRGLLRIDLGATWKRELDELPATIRYFAGGDNSVRGYGYETIGPVDADGEVIGGSNLVVVSLEADRLISANWAIAAFVDSGSAFSGTAIDMLTGIGVGVRWYSPLGPIRIDIAHPLDDPDQDYRFHITLGPDL